MPTCREISTVQLENTGKTVNYSTYLPGMYNKGKTYYHGSGIDIRLK